MVVNFPIAPPSNTCSLFLPAVENGKIERVRFSKDGSALQLTAVDGRRATVTLPNDPDLVDILAKNGESQRQRLYLPAYACVCMPHSSGQLLMLFYPQLRYMPSCCRCCSFPIKNFIPTALFIVCMKGCILLGTLFCYAKQCILQKVSFAKQLEGP